MDVLVVDAFATEPMAGRPVAVFPEADLTDDQYRVVAEELGAAGTLAAEPGGLSAVGARGDVALAVAAGALFLGFVILLHHRSETPAAIRSFHASNAYLGIVLVSIILETAV